MDTLAFYQAILPDEGPYYLVLLKQGAPAHKSCNTLEELAELTAKFSKNPKLAVYHACASYQQAFVLGDNGKKIYRKPPNWNRAKALWVDLDCGEDKAAKGQGYATKKDAFTAILHFCKEIGFPPPTVVDSGNGVHCYWTLTKDISYKSWVPLATAFKRVLSEKGVLQDGTRTADFASILRPVGTINRKRGEKPVVLKRAGVPSRPEDLLTALRLHVKTVNDSIDVLPYAPVDGGGSNEDLTKHYVDAPKDADVMAQKCRQVGIVRDTGGDASYEHWRGVIGLLTFFDDGRKRADEWSKKRKNTGHSNNDVETRFTSWNAGPTTCSFFKSANPDGCAGCPYDGAINTPLRLAYTESVEAGGSNDVYGERPTTARQNPPFPLPKGFAWDGKRLYRIIREIGKDGLDLVRHEIFCASLFWPTGRVRKEDGTYSTAMTAVLPDGRVREFAIDTGLLSSPTKLVEELGHKAEIVPTNDKNASANISAYLRDSLTDLKTRAEEVNTMTSFGWKHANLGGEAGETRSFLIGDRLYHADGTTRNVLLGGYGLDFLVHFPRPTGRIAAYASALDSVYNHEGMEPLQYAIGSAFGSILTPMGDLLYRGLLVAITGGETARGKSTVCHAALYAFGDAQRMTIKTEKGATINAQYARMGTYNNIPVLFDEFTSIAPDALSVFAYNISSGEEKDRLGMRGGSPRKVNQAEWSMSPYITANRDMHALLSEHSINSQAEAVRLIQIKVDNYDIPVYPDGYVSNALAKMRSNQGVAGEAFIKHVVANYEAVKKRFDATKERITAYIAGDKYRFYRDHAAATLTAVQLMVELGIASFDYEKLFSFTMEFLVESCKAVRETNMVSTEDAISYMLNSMSDRIVSTTEYRDARNVKGPELVPKVRGAVAGRLILGNTSKDPLAGKLYIVKKEVRDWCAKNRTEYGAVIRHAQKIGILVNEDEKFNVTRGTDLPPLQVPCIALDARKMEELLTAPVLTVHTNPDVATDTKSAVK